MTEGRSRQPRPFFVMLSRKPKDGQSRQYELVPSAPFKTTHAAEQAMFRLCKQQNIKLNDGDLLVVTQITRAKKMNSTEKVIAAETDPHTLNVVKDRETEQKPDTPQDPVTPNVSTTLDLDDASEETTEEQNTEGTEKISPEANQIDDPFAEMEETKEDIVSEESSDKKEDKTGETVPVASEDDLDDIF